MRFYAFEPDVSEFEVKEEKIVSALGYNESPDFISERLNDLLQESLSAAKINCGFGIFDQKSLTINSDSILINSIGFDIRKIIGLHLRNADEIAIFAATIGTDFDKLISNYKKTDLLDTFLIDSIGSELVEMVGDWLEDKLQKVVGDKKISNRLSPGYCGWDIAEQHKLFSLLPEKFCGISLNDSALMNPVKSISGIIGIGEKLKRQDYQCRICNLELCYKRNRSKAEDGKYH